MQEPLVVSEKVIRVATAITTIVVVAAGVEVVDMAVVVVDTAVASLAETNMDHLYARSID